MEYFLGRIRTDIIRPFFVEKCYWNKTISRKHSGKCYGKDNTLLDKIAATTTEKLARAWKN